MNNGRVRVLWIDDDEEGLDIIRNELTDVSGSVIEWNGVGAYERGQESLYNRVYDGYLIDDRLEMRDGIELIQIAVAEGSQAPLILLTGMGQHDIVKQTMPESTSDFLAKGRIDGVDIERSVMHAIKRVLVAEEYLQQDAELKLLSEQLPVILWTTADQLHFTSGDGAGLQQPGLVPSQLLELSLHEFSLTTDPVDELIEPHLRSYCHPNRPHDDMMLVVDKVDANPSA